MKGNKSTSLTSCLYVNDQHSENNIEDIVESLKTDFNGESQIKLKRLLIEIINSDIPIIDDEYTVQVNIKDPSIYTYAPRRFAHAERIEIRKITDDLIKRDIIQPSISPYCARVVPVRKKNGQTRLCVDLRPLTAE